MFPLHFEKIKNWKKKSFSTLLLLPEHSANNSQLRCRLMTGTCSCLPVQAWTWHRCCSDEKPDSCKINPFFHPSMTWTSTSRTDIPVRSLTTKYCAWGVCLPWDERLLLTVASSQATQTRKVFSASLLEKKVKISGTPTAFVMCKKSCCKETHSASQRSTFCYGTAATIMHPPIGFSSGWHQSQHRCSYLCTLERQLMTNGAF